MMRKAALDEGIRDFIIKIGGSATNDGGIAAAQALGVEFWDRDNHLISTLEARNWEGLAELSRTELIPRIRESNITVICDVTNSL